MQNGSPMAINMGQRRLNVQAQDGYKKVSNIEAEELRTIVNRMQTDGDGTNIGVSRQAVFFFFFPYSIKVKLNYACATS